MTPVSRWLAACVAAVGLLAASPAFAADGDTVASPESWVQEVHDAREALVEARVRVDRAVEAYQQVRHRRRQRGELKADVIAELEAAKAALPLAQARLDAALAGARRAGVAPGLLRADPSPAPPAQLDSGRDAN